MDFYNVPIGFGFALAQNEAAMLYYAHLSEQEKKAVLDRSRNLTSKEEMYSLVAELAGGKLQ